MNQLAADQQLTLTAFQTAIDTYNQQGKTLPEEIATLTQSLEQHLDQLDTLSETDPTFEMVYQAARSALQNQSSQRAKFLDTSTPIDSTNGIHPGESKPDRNGHATTQLNHSNSNGFQTSSPTQIHQPTIYRYTLPSNATTLETATFHQQVEAIRQANPDWIITFDRPQPGEADAIVMVHKDEQYAQVHAAYITSRTLNDIVAPALNRVFRNRS